MKDLTKIKTPFGLLKPKLQGRMEAHRAANGLIEIYIGGKWEDDPRGEYFDDRFTYRTKPGFPILPNDEALKEVIEAYAHPHPIFAAVKEWQDARFDAKASGGFDTPRYTKAMNALAAIKVPS